MTRHPDAFVGTSALDRVRAYLDARKGAQGMDPEDIHAYGTRGVVYELTVSDLRAVLATAEASPYRPDRITDQNVQDIVDTASYGGITYWATQPTREDFEAAPGAQVAVIRDGEEDKVHYVMAHQIRQAVVEIAEGKHTNDTIAGYVRSAFDHADEDGLDCGDIDASAADCIIQVACFGEVVYG